MAARRPCLAVTRSRFAAVVGTCLLVWVAGTVALGAWVDRQIEGGILDRTAADTGLYVQSLLSPYVQSLADSSRIDPAAAAGLQRLVFGTDLASGTVSVKVWSPQGEVLYSPTAALVGQRFPVRGQLARAIDGAVAFEVSNLQDAENVYERPRWRSLLETYVPVRAQGSTRVVGAAELYQLPDELESAIFGAKLRASAAIALAALGSFVLFVIALVYLRRSLQARQLRLDGELAALSHAHRDLLQAQRDSGRAAMRALVGMEAERRSIGRRLEDGPGQQLGLALLRLDGLRSRGPSADEGGRSHEVDLLQGAMQDALAEVRSVVAATRIPDLTGRDVQEVVDRAMGDLASAPNLTIKATFGELPLAMPLGLKVVLFRSLQDVLHHLVDAERATAISIRVWATHDRLNLLVSDLTSAPAVERDFAAPALSLLRERAELVGGLVRVASDPGRRLAIQASWPLLTDERSA